MSYVHQTLRLRAATTAAAAGAPSKEVDLAAVQQQRHHLEAALTALRLLIEGNPRLLALMSSRPALAPLLQCIEPSTK